MALFESNSLIDGTQVTVPRWAQEGSTLVNIQDTVDDSSTRTSLYEVPAGKILYITNVTIQVYISTNVSSDTGTLIDYETSNRNLIQYSFADTPEGTVIDLNFDSAPLYVLDELMWYSPNPSTADYSIFVTITGWTEDA
jgi:hypothetical protein